MAKTRLAKRNDDIAFGRRRLLLAAVGGLAGPAGAATGAPGLRWLTVSADQGRIQARDLGLVVNTADPYSVEVGRYYAQRRGLVAGQILELTLPVRSSLEPAEFAALRERVDAYFGDTTQALALAWTRPYAVGCNSLSGALALGFDADLCRQSCAPTRPSRYFNHATATPYRALGIRPSMHLAARSVASAEALIDRGVAADHSLGLRGAPAVQAHFVVTGDTARSVREVLFPPPGLLARFGVDVRVTRGERLPADADRVLVYETGRGVVDGLDRIRWVPGALADHLTSAGGVLDGDAQMSVLSWIESGATASYGTSSEPCNHLQKFPHPQLLLEHYLQGVSAIEAYWKSVAWPLQGVFVGEPLAAPFARRS